jgi:hypothetical protein
MQLWPDIAMFGVMLAAGVAVETTLGFGSAMVSLSLASLLWPLQSVIPLQVALGLLVSVYIVTRYRDDVELERLVRGYLPAALVGALVGIALGAGIAGAALSRVFGAAVLLLAGLQLARAFAGGPAAPLPAHVRGAALFGAGVMHGLYAIGGPLVVYVASREPFGKGAFRATLSALWLVLGLLLIATFVVQGRLGAADAPALLCLVVPVLAGMRFGEWLHHRVPERPFRMAVLSLVALIGAKLLLA